MQHDGERLYRCPLCLDEGLVLVWHQRSMKVMRQAIATGAEFKGPRYSCGVRCNCPAGSRWPIKVFFSELTMLPCDYHPSDEDAAALREWIEGESAGTDWIPTESYADIVGGDF